MSGASDQTSLPYRLGVGLMLFNPQGLVFTAKRIDTEAEAWQMPQGGIDEGETPRQALFREMKEEIGTDCAEILGESAEQVASALGLSIPAQKSRLHRARQIVREALDSGLGCRSLMA